MLHFDAVFLLKMYCQASKSTAMCHVLRDHHMSATLLSDKNHVALKSFLSIGSEKQPISSL